jgi:hypothetical protein
MLFVTTISIPELLPEAEVGHIEVFLPAYLLETQQERDH